MLRQPLLLGETDGADSVCTRHGPIERPTSASSASTRLARLGRRQRRRCDRRRPLSAGSAAGGRAASSRAGVCRCSSRAAESAGSAAGGAALWSQRRGRRCGTARPAAHNQFQNPTFGVTPPPRQTRRTWARPASDALRRRQQQPAQPAGREGAGRRRPSSRTGAQPQATGGHVQRGHSRSAREEELGGGGERGEPCRRRAAAVVRLVPALLHFLVIKPGSVESEKCIHRSCIYYVSISLVCEMLRHVEYIIRTEVCPEFSRSFQSSVI